MSAIDEFLDRGSLPFIGRERELAGILAFWRGALPGDEMRILLLEGEAGVGKSRLVAEAAGAIEAERGTVVHARLYAETTAAIAPLLHEALARTELGRRIVPAETTLAGVADALRRLARLRPTVIIIEDIHLLPGAPVRELVLLLESIEEEPVAVVLTTRTQDHPARHVLERWPLETLEVPSLERSEIGGLWQRLFGGPVGDETLARLADATLGNPLALRSALRGALRKAALRRDAAGAWVPEPTFDTVASRSATSLVEGMLAGIGETDRAAAATLATLGEVFSREAARAMFDDPTLQALFDAGLLHELAAMKLPLPALQRSASFPIAYSHSLVHRRLADEAVADVVRLVAMVSVRAPLHSIEPFEHLATAAALPDSVPQELVLAAIDTSLSVALGLDKTSDWALAMTAHRAAERLFELAYERWSDDVRRERSVAIAARRLALMRRQMTSPEYGAALARFSALVADVPPELAWYRLTRAIADARRRYLVDGYDAGRALYDEVRAIVERNPELRLHQQYVLVLQTFAQFAAENGDNARRHEIECEYRELLADERLGEDHRILLQTQIPPHLLTLFESPAELAERERMYIELKELERNPSSMARLLVHAMLPSEPEFLARTGRVDELVAFVDARLDMLRSQGMLVVHHYFRLYRLWADTLLGADADLVRTQLGSLVEEYRRTLATPAHESSGDVTRIIAAALVRGDVALAASLRDEYSIDLAALPVGSDVLLDADQPRDVAAAFSSLARHIVGIDDLVELRASLTAMSGAALTNQQSNRARASLVRALEWLEARRLDVPMRSLLETFGDLPSSKDLAAWRRRAAAIAEERAAQRAPAVGDARLRISMLGRIEIRRAGETEAVQPRGARQKSFLGAMVARELLTRPLERDEFLEAAGIERSDDPKLARDAVNSAIYRLRDVIGHESVLTDEETPRLNMERVGVDLVDAWRSLRRSDEALRRGALGLASRALLDALDLTRGEVPFPALYERFFEAMREDIENELRTSSLSVARRLLAESDPGGASEILERCFRFTPDDEEIAELYCEALESQGRRTEAERVRWRLEAEVG